MRRPIITLLTECIMWCLGVVFLEPRRFLLWMFPDWSPHIDYACTSLSLLATWLSRISVKLLVIMSYL